MTETPVQKYCNCGACGVKLPSQDVFRRLRYGVRIVPLCGRCGIENDGDVVAMLGGETAKTLTDATQGI